MVNRIHRDEAHHSLHKYFLLADKARLHLDGILLKKRRKKHDDLDLTLYRSLWYGLLYVVVEGMEELKIEDSGIGRLLKSPNKDLLRRFRNGVFHFQANYYDARFEDFLNKKSSDKWVRKLHFEIGRYFIPGKFALDKWQELIEIRNRHHVK
jgi:hypothetical protein